MATEIIVALVIAVIVVVGIGFLILMTARRNDARTDFVISESVAQAFSDENREIGRAYAEMSKLSAWLNESEGVDLNAVCTLSDERLKALAIKKAEDAVTLVEADLAACRRAISNKQRHLFENVAFGSILEQDKGSLKTLGEQEKYLEGRLEMIRGKYNELRRIITTLPN